MNQKQLQELMQKRITMAIKPLEDKITALTNEVKNLQDSLSFIREKHDFLPMSTTKFCAKITNNKRYQVAK